MNLRIRVLKANGSRIEVDGGTVLAVCAQSLRDILMVMRHLRFREESNVRRRHRRRHRQPHSDGPHVDPRLLLKGSPECKIWAYERCQTEAIYSKEKRRAMANMDAVRDRWNRERGLAGSHGEELFRKSESASNAKVTKSTYRQKILGIPPQSGRAARFCVHVQS
jgi:hypothetical protein